MKLRFKFLCFLAVFLTGSFLIVTWKSYDIFSRKYVQTFQQMQLQDLEKQSALIATQIENLQPLLRKDPREMESQLKTTDVLLLARIVKDAGKWKAQWFEGSGGERAMAAGLAKQIPFETLSATQRSWHRVRIKDQGTHWAYVIPASQDNKISYYVFFLKPDFLNKTLKTTSLAENITVFSPQLGEMYSLAERPTDFLENYRATLQKNKRGIIAVDGKNAVVYFFQPDLQLYFIKNFTVKNLVIESAAYLTALFAIILGLIALSLFALDLLMANVFQRIVRVTHSLRAQVQAPSLETGHFADELTELEMLVESLQEAPSSLAADNHKVSAEVSKSAPSFEREEFVQNLRPKVINSLGYLNRLKSAFPAEAPQLQLLEKELRELRATIDPSQPLSLQPTFNPLIDFQTKSTENETSATLIRKPKRETHESYKI